MPHVDQLIARYGYLAIFSLLMLGIVGPAIPDETILVVSGILARQGKLDYIGVLGAGYFGSLCGITVSYTLGRNGLFYLLLKIPFVRKNAGAHMERVHDWFERYGRWTLFFGYFVAGVRHFTALAAGASKMSGRHFAIYAYTGGMLWVICFVSLGYFLGDQWERSAEWLNRGAGTIAIAAAVCALGWFWWKRCSRGHRQGK
jgi:membrane protein DedA with SNARE-associated domain